MVELWELNGPPVYIAVAAYLGMLKDRKSRKTKKKGSAQSSSNEGNLASLAQMLSSSGGVLNG